MGEPVRAMSLQNLKASYRTPYGAAYVGDALALLDHLEADSVDLVLTSPPFALQREKSYGNVNQEAYVQWLLQFCKKVYRVLAPTGSLVLDIGGAYQSRRPVRSLYPFQLVIRLCEELDFRLAEEFFWFNPSKLPSPIEWVNKRKIRAKDAVNIVWWLSKTDEPKADFARPADPDGARGGTWQRDTVSVGPTNLLQIAHSESASPYLRLCKTIGVEPHPARFPVRLPRFFIEALTDPGEVVLDIFAGSNATGQAAQMAQRRWIAFEVQEAYLASSLLRFVDPGWTTEKVTALYQQALHEGGVVLDSPRLAGQMP